jgi:hypothetical protein
MLHLTNATNVHDTNTDAKDAVTGSAVTQWFQDLQALAAKRDLSHLITTLEDHGPGYADGYSPAQELRYQVELASQAERT